jgi:hypothetical protein
MGWVTCPLVSNHFSLQPLRQKENSMPKTVCRGKHRVVTTFAWKVEGEGDLRLKGHKQELSERLF